jgi:dCTP deaminase
MILGDRDLKNYIEKRWITISPLSSDSIRENGIDLKVGNEIARFKKTASIFDSNKPEEFFLRERGSEFIIHPHEHILVTTAEYLSLHNDVIAFVNLRTSFARLGLFIPPTIVDAGYRGELTVEIVGSEFPVRLMSGTRFLHLVFARTLTPVERPYAGKYSEQRGITLAKI